MIYNLLLIRIKKYLQTIKNEKKTSEGIITLADANYFQGLLILYHSVQKSYPVPIICYDIGLTREQKKWCSENLDQLTILEIPKHDTINTIKKYQENTKLAKKSKRQWPLWICPFLIQASPFEKTFWFDCDILILRNLEQLFKKLETGPVFTPENLAPQVTANKPELYKLLPLNRASHFEEKALINAGVSGWKKNRDNAVLADYASVVKKAFENKNIKNAISWHDQGALIWAILNNNLEYRIQTNWKWNMCVKHTAIRDMKFTWSLKNLEKIQAKVTNANILHWNGQSVPWNK